MEQYWCLRWLEQEGVRDIDALVLRENLVRLEGLPLTLRVSSLPELAAGSRVRLALDSLDLLERAIVCSWRATLRDGAAQTY
jgi:exoribonuclease-2